MNPDGGDCSKIQHPWKQRASVFFTVVPLFHPLSLSSPPLKLSMTYMAFSGLNPMTPSIPTKKKKKKKKKQ